MLRENEKWIPGHEYRYSVTTDGDIFSYISGSAYKLSTHILFDKTRNVYTYFAVGLIKNGKQNLMYCHRAVASAFIPNPENKPYVNHKDLNKQNNNVENLEWVTPSENAMHARINGAYPVQEDPDPKKTEIERQERANRFILYGDTMGYTESWSRKLLRPVDLENNLIPKEFLLIIWNKETLVESLKYYIELFEEILSGKEGRSIGVKYSLHESTVSRIKARKFFQGAWDIYDKMKGDPKYDKWFK